MKRNISSFSVTLYSMSETPIWISFEIFSKIKLHPRGKYAYTHFIFLLGLWNTSQFKYLFIYLF